MVKQNPFNGTWYIDEMDMWDSDFINLVQRGFIEFDNNSHGQMFFGCVDVSLHCRLKKNESNPKIEFSFEGDDEGSPISGRGWAILENKVLKGHIFLHMGDESGFSASKQ